MKCELDSRGGSHLATHRKQTFKAGVLYFAVVFGAGFALGTIRTLWIVPRVGTRLAELIGVLRRELTTTPAFQPIGNGMHRVSPDARCRVWVRALDWGAKSRVGGLRRRAINQGSA